MPKPNLNGDQVVFPAALTQVLFREIVQDVAAYIEKTPADTAAAEEHLAGLGKEATSTLHFYLSLGAALAGQFHSLAQGIDIQGFDNSTGRMSLTQDGRLIYKRNRRS